MWCLVWLVLQNSLTKMHGLFYGVGLYIPSYSCIYYLVVEWKYIVKVNPSTTLQLYILYILHFFKNVLMYTSCCHFIVEEKVQSSFNRRLCWIWYCDIIFWFNIIKLWPWLSFIHDKKTNLIFQKNHGNYNPLSSQKVLRSDVCRNVKYLIAIFIQRRLFFNKLRWYESINIKHDRQ